MVHLVLHSGMPKAGSTELQRVFAHNTEAFQEHAYLYPMSGSDGVSHRPLFESLLNKDFDALKSCSHAMKREIHQTNSKSVIISCEDFFFLDLHQIHLFFSFIQSMKCISSISIVFIFRRPDSWFDSWYNQWVKAKSIKYAHGILELLENWDQLPRIFRYYDRIQDWETGFPSARILALSHSRNPGMLHLAKQFLSAVGLNELELSFQSKHPANISLSLESLAILRRLNKEDINAETRRRLLSALTKCDRIRRDKGENFQQQLLPDDNRLRILRDARPQNESLAKKYHNGLDLFPGPVAFIGSANYIKSLELEADQVDDACGILDAKHPRARQADFQHNIDAIEILRTIGYSAIRDGCGPLLRSAAN